MKCQGNRAPSSVPQGSRATSRFGFRIEVRTSCIHRGLCVWVRVKRVIGVRRSRLPGKKSSDSEMSLEILGFKSINPPLQKCLKMDTCFLEEQVARYSNAPKYAIPSAAVCLAALNFKKQKFGISNYKDVEFGILRASFLRINSLAVTNTLQRRCSVAGNSGSTLVFEISTLEILSIDSLYDLSMIYKGFKKHSYGIEFYKRLKLKKSKI